MSFPPRRWDQGVVRTRVPSRTGRDTVASREGARRTAWRAERGNRLVPLGDASAGRALARRGLLARSRAARRRLLRGGSELHRAGLARLRGLLLGLVLRAERRPLARALAALRDLEAALEERGEVHD